MKTVLNKEDIPGILDLLVKADSVEDVAELLNVSSKTLRRLFARNDMLSPSDYLKPKTHVLSNADKTNIRALYSDVGEEYSATEIAIKLQLPLELIQGYIKDAKLNHKILPLGEHELNLSDKEKIKRSLEVRDYKLKSKLESVISQKIQDSANKWENWNKNVLNPLLSLIEKEVPKYTIEKLNLKEIKPYAAILSIQDFHFGRLASSLETKENTSMEIQSKHLMDSVDSLMSRLFPFGQPQKLYLTIGGDFINSDNSKLTTTHGTPQDSFPSHTALTVKGSLLLIKMIDKLRQFFPLIELIPTPGNHDNDSSVSLYMFCSAWFRECEDVITFFDITDEERNIRKRQYRKYGNSLLAFAHGDGTQIKDNPVIIANEARELWGQTKYCILTTGHKHFRISQDLFGIQHNQVPTLAIEDRWGETKGFQNQKGMNILLIDKEQGYLGEIVVNV